MKEILVNLIILRTFPLYKNLKPFCKSAELDGELEEQISLRNIGVWLQAWKLQEVVARKEMEDE